MSSTDSPGSDINKINHPKPPRGPNSHRVREAFGSINSKPQRLDHVLARHNVSPHVIKQGKRFDPFKENGKVVIKQMRDKNDEKHTYIWRVKNEA